MSLFSRSKGNQRAMAEAKAEFEKVVDAVKDDRRVDRPLRSRIAFRTRSHIDQTFIEGAKKAEIYDHLCLQAIAKGETKPDEPEPALFKVIKNSIAVSNSTENLKKLAKIITTKKSGEGVLEGLDMIASDLR